MRHQVSVLMMLGLALGGCAQFPSSNETLWSLIEQRGRAEPQLSQYDQGKRHLELERYGLAISAFENVLSKDPKSTPALNGLAVAYERLGRTDVAQHYLDLAIATDPQSAVTLNNLAYFNLLQGKSQIALDYAERAQGVLRTPATHVPDEVREVVVRNIEIAGQLVQKDIQETALKQTLRTVEMSTEVEKQGANEWRISSSPQRFIETTPLIAPSLQEEKKTPTDGVIQLPAETQIRVSNGTGRRLMATRFAGYLSNHGLAVRQITNAATFDYKESVIFYNPGGRENASELADLLPFTVKLIEAKKGSGQIEVVLGADLFAFDDSLAPI